MIKDCVIKEFTMNYSILDKDMYEGRKYLYDFAIIIVEMKEFKKGFKVKRINKANKNGTKIKYIAFTSSDNIEDYQLKFNNYLENVDMLLLHKQLSEFMNEYKSKNLLDGDNIC